MPTPIPYGSDWLFEFLLLDPDDANVHVTSIPTIAAGDVKVRTDAQVIANPAALILGFDSMSEEPEPGVTIDENGAGTATAVVMFVVIVTGTIGGGDAAGFMFVKSVSGEAWSDNDQIDINGGTANVATVDAGTTGVYTLAANQLANTAGLFAFADATAYVAITAAEGTCKRGGVRIADQTDPPEWKDDGEMFRTIGDSDAEYPPEGGSGVASAGSVSAVTDAQTFRVSDIDSAADDDWNHHLIEVIDASSGQSSADWVADYDHGNKEFVLETGLKFTPQAGDEVKVYVIRRDTQPAKFAGSSSQAATAIVEAIESSGTDTAVDAIKAVTDDMQGEFATFFGIVTGAVATDGGNSATGFEVDTSQGSKVVKGMLRLTSGALSGEGCLVSWTGTTVTVISETSMPTALKQFSATPADAVTFAFTPF